MADNGELAQSSLKPSSRPSTAYLGEGSSVDLPRRGSVLKGLPSAGTVRRTSVTDKSGGGGGGLAAYKKKNFVRLAQAEHAAAQLTSRLYTVSAKGSGPHFNLAPKLLPINNSKV